MRVLQSSGAFLGLVILVVGPPVALVRSVGNPWPAEGITLDAPLTDGAIIGVLAVLVWVLWAQLMVCIVVEFVAALTGDRIAGRVPFALGAQQQLARRLVTLVLAGSFAVPVLTMASNAAATVEAPAPTLVSAVVNSTPKHEALQEISPSVESRTTVTVMRGDTLWSIAESQLGDGSRWTQIAELNKGRDMGDGSTFDSSRPIRPGWELTIPSVQTESVSQSTTTPVDHVVKKGDTLSHIAAAELGDAQRWPELFEASKNIDQPQPLTNPHLIYPGQRIISDTTVLQPEVETPANPDTSAQPRAKTPMEQDTPDLNAGPDLKKTPSTDVTQEPDDTTDDAEPLVAMGLTKSSTALTGPTDGPDDPGMPSWIAPAFVGAGALLAAGLGIGLRRRRSAAARARECGEVPVLSTTGDLVIESSVTVAGRPAEPVLEEVDAVMTWVAAMCAATQNELPQLGAIELTPTAIALHLRFPAAVIDRFTATDDHMVWVTGRGQDWTVDDDATDRPWPLVATVGDVDQSIWLLNFEAINVALTGHQENSEAFIRHVVADLACAPWSRQVQLSVDPTLSATTGLNPDRITVHTDLSETFTTTAVHIADDIAERLENPEVRIATVRAQGSDPDGWPASMFVCTRPISQQALDDLHTRTHKAGSAVVTNTPSSGDFEIHVDDAGMLTAPAVGLTVQAVALTSDEAQACADILHAADDITHTAAPDHTADTEWSQFATVTGELRAEYVTPRGLTTLEESASLLPAKDDTYLVTGATTATDLEQIAPQVTATVSEKIIEADPTLDADLDDWRNAESHRPKLRLLGPVTAATSGRALAKRKPFYTELFAYIMLREHGATTEEVAAAFDMTPARVRTDINVLRGWLGTDPASNQTYLPDARKAPGAQVRGIGVYQVPSALVDADLFRRLRLRAQATGNTEDLVTALSLVTGRPFEKLRPGGWGWLLEGDRADLYMPVAVVDVAHTIVTRALADNDLATAEHAVEAAAKAAPDEEIVRLDRVAILTAAGHDTTAQQLLLDEVCNRREDDEHGPEELSDRTNEVLVNRDWPTRKVI